jgi:hypothetical protein
VGFATKFDLLLWHASVLPWKSRQIAKPKARRLKFRSKADQQCRRVSSSAV